MNFIAIDVETANADVASICQIGLVKYEDGILSDEWKTYIDPEDYFHYMNVSIHGIDESIVRGAPKFPEVVDRLRSYLEGKVVISHTHFDRAAVQRAARRYSIEAIECTWLDSAKVARRAWRECAWRGYGLFNVCRNLGYDFQHHDALEDAKAAAYIILAAAAKTGLNIEGWLGRVRQPVNPKKGRSARKVTFGQTPGLGM